MITPTRRAVGLMLAGAPVGLLLGVYAPELWLVGAAWAGLVLALVLLDAVLSPSRRKLEAEVAAPADLSSGGRAGELRATLRFDGAAPTRVDAMLETDARIAADPARLRLTTRGSEAQGAFTLTGKRRGEGRLERLWVRWTGPLGLADKQRAFALDRVVPVTPDIAGVKQAALRLFARDAAFGLKSQIELGEGSEYNALKEFQPGMDIRAVDWKQSARHGSLLVKEFRTERNHPLILALDTGRLMCEPVGGVPKIDRALNAALLLGYVGLRMGDRVGLFAFDAKPRLSTPAASGAHAYPLLQRLAAKIDYSTEETNYTLGLTTLGGSLERRSLIVMFTDFADATSAELMLENAGRLAKRHLLLFVVLQDEELDSMVRAEPRAPEDVSRAVVAGALLRERELVIARLRRLGAEIVEARADQLGPDLIARYLTLKRRDRL